MRISDWSSDVCSSDLGIRHIVLAVNKMDLVGYDKGVFDRITLAYRAFASEIGITNFTAIPISGFKGDNIAAASANTPWYKGPALIEHLEGVEVAAQREVEKEFRMPVQWEIGRASCRARVCQ